MKEAEDISEWCVANLKHYPDVLLLIDDRLQKVKKPMEVEIPRKLDDLEKKLKNSLQSSKQFVDDTDDLQRWLVKMEKILPDQKPVSADKDTCSRQQNNHKYVVEDVHQHEPKFTDLLQAGQGLFDSAEPGNEKDTLMEKLDNLKERWNDVKEKTYKRKEVLDEVVVLAIAFDEDKSKMLPWLDHVENKLDSLGCISVDPITLDTQEKELEELLDEVKKQRPLLDHLVECGEPLSEKPDADTEPVKETVDAVKKRYFELEKKLEDAKDKVEKMKNGVERFEAALKPVEELCDQAETALNEKEPFADDAVKGEKEVERLKKLLDELITHKPDVGKVRKAGDDLIAIEDKPDNITAVYQKTDALANKYDDLIDKLKEKVDETEKAKESANNFHCKLDDVKDKTKPISDNSQALAPLGATPEKVKEQLVEVEELQNQLQQANNLFNEAEMFGDEIIDFNGKDPVIEKCIRDQLEDVKKPLDENSEILNDREKKLKDQLKECGAFQDQVDDFTRRIKNIDDRVEQQMGKPLSMKPGPLNVTVADLEVRMSVHFIFSMTISIPLLSLSFLLFHCLNSLLPEGIIKNLSC